MREKKKIYSSFQLERIFSWPGEKKGKKREKKGKKKGKKDCLTFLPPKNQGLVKKVCFSRDLDEIYRLTQQKIFISNYFSGKTVSNFDTIFDIIPEFSKSKIFKIPG